MIKGTMASYATSKENIKDGIYKLNSFNATKGSGQGTTRILFTQEELKARTYIKSLMEEIGLTIEEDSIGNIFGVLEGSEPDLPCVWSGSHIDTVKNAGMFDGMAGVIAAIEALRVIKDNNIIHRRTIKAVVYTSEEPTRFGLSCLGSRAMAGVLERHMLKDLMDEEGKTLERCLEELGYDLEKYSEVKKRPGEIHASVELHIEQGSVLEKLGKPIGIVEAICAPTNLEVKVTGIQEHAGSTPMAIRKDALVASSEIVVAIEKLVHAYGQKHTVGTVGLLEVYPNAANVIPGQVRFTIDMRDNVMDTKEVLLKKIKELFLDIEQKRGVTIDYELLNHDTPRSCHANINQVVESICLNKNIPFHKMVSGAYHDSIFVAEFAPTTMIFVPSKGGVSHHHSEWTDFDDIKKGADVLLNSLFVIANN